MKITGKIVFEATPGRKDPWVKKQLKNDYFLALQITEIDGHPVQTTNDMFIAMKDKFPKISINKEAVNHLFTNVTLPPNAKDIPHITLGNFPDFRLDRSVENEIDENKLIAAREVQDNILNFEGNFEFVIACINPNIVDRISQGHLIQIDNGDNKVIIASTVGFNRDAVLNIKPNLESQKLLSEYSKKVFGNQFELWNSESKPVPYHLTIAQTNQFKNKLELAYQALLPEEDLSQLSISLTNS